MSHTSDLLCSAIMCAEGRISPEEACREAGLPVTTKGAISTAWFRAYGPWAHVYRTPLRPYLYWYDPEAEAREPRPEDDRKPARAPRPRKLGLHEARQRVTVLEAEVAQLRAVIVELAACSDTLPGGLLTSRVVDL